jgi:capsule polysaccharide export protein KpsE/RkpR
MGGMAASLLGLKSPGEVFVSMMNSDTVRDRIIDRFNLMKLYGTKFIEDARKKMSKNAKIMAGKKDGILVIEVTSTAPKLAAEMANAFIDELEKLLQSLANQEAKGRLAFLEKERLQTSQNLTKAEEAMRHFSEKNSVLQIDTQTKGALEYIARLRAEIDSKEVSIQVLRQQATPFNYDVVRLETEIKGMKEKLRTAECQYDSNLTDVCLPTNKTPGLALEYIRLYREAKFQESLYQLYIKLVEIARMDMARDIAVIQVVDAAKPPEKRSNKRLIPSLLAGMVTFFMMIFVAFGREYIQNMNNNGYDDRRLSVLKDYLKSWMDMLTRIKKVFRFKKRS